MRRQRLAREKQIKGYFKAFPIVYDMYKLTFVLILKKLNFNPIWPGGGGVDSTHSKLKLL